MPYVSQAQARKIHAAARRGEKWAVKWVRESRGQDVKSLPERKQMPVDPETGERLPYGDEGAPPRRRKKKGKKKKRRGRRPPPRNDEGGGLAAILGAMGAGK